jgi:hypothetical protein
MRNALRGVLAAAIGLTVASCGIARRAEFQARADQLNAQSAAAMQACAESFPGEDNPKTAVAEIKCVTDAMEIRRPVERYPDLLEAERATMISLAEQLQNGKLTGAQFKELVANKHAELTSEAKRRDVGARSAAAQEAIAPAIRSTGGPYSCTTTGATTNCY